jgi:hypothetical protein
MDGIQSTSVNGKGSPYLHISRVHPWPVIAGKLYLGSFLKMLNRCNTEEVTLE